MSISKRVEELCGKIEEIKNELLSVNQEIYSLENKQEIPVEPPIIVCPPEVEKPQPEPEEKPKYEMFLPHHEVLTDKYLDPNDRTIFNKTSLNSVLNDRLGFKNYFIYYPSGVSTSEYNARKIDTSKIEEKVISCVGEDFEGIGMLDYEGEWFRALDKGVEDKENQIITDVMIEAIHYLKKRFPKMKWGFYDLPKMPYWLPHPSPTNSYTWETAPDQLKEQTMEFYLNAYSRLLKECDYINVSRYHRYDPDSHNVDISVRESEWRKKCTELAHRVNKVNSTNLPIYAMYHKGYPRGGKAEFTGKLVQPDFLLETLVKPHIEAGVNGFMYWDAVHYYTWTAIPTNNTNPDYIAANAFCKNYNYDYTSIPWKKGQGPEEERTKWRNKIVEHASQSAFDLMAFVYKHVSNL